MRFLAITATAGKVSFGRKHATHKLVISLFHQQLSCLLGNSCLLNIVTSHDFLNKNVSSSKVFAIKLGNLWELDSPMISMHPVSAVLTNLPDNSSD